MKYSYSLTNKPIVWPIPQQKAKTWAPFCDDFPLESLFTNRPLVTIGVPIFNTQESFLRPMIESILAVATKYGNAEIVLHDDGSTKQHVRDVLAAYKKSNSDLINLSLSDKNQGISVARQHLVNATNGKYFLSFDSDDIMIDFSLARAVYFLEKNPQYICSYTRKYFFKGESLTGEIGALPYCSPLAGLFQMQQVPNGALIRTSAMVSCGGYLPKVAHVNDDILLFAKLSEYGLSAYDHYPRCFGRIHAENQTDKTDESHDGITNYALSRLEYRKDIIKELLGNNWPDAPDYIIKGVIGGYIFTHQAYPLECVNLLDRYKDHFTQDPMWYTMRALLNAKLKKHKAVIDTIQEAQDTFAAFPYIEFDLVAQFRTLLHMINLRYEPIEARYSEILAMDPYNKSWASEKFKNTLRKFSC